MLARAGPPLDLVWRVANQAQQTDENQNLNYLVNWPAGLEQHVPLLPMLVHLKVLSFLETCQIAWLVTICPNVESWATLRDLTETRTQNAPRHGQDENLMMPAPRRRMVVRTINCESGVYPELWPWPAFQSGVSDRCLHSTLASPLFPNRALTKGLRTVALLLLFDINAQSANTIVYSIQMFDQWKSAFREMPLVHLIDWWTRLGELVKRWKSICENQEHRLEWCGNASQRLDNMILGLKQQSSGH